MMRKRHESVMSSSMGYASVEKIGADMGSRTGLVDDELIMHLIFPSEKRI